MDGEDYWLFARLGAKNNPLALTKLPLQSLVSRDLSAVTCPGTKTSNTQRCSLGPGCSTMTTRSPDPQKLHSPGRGRANFYGCGRESVPAFAALPGPPGAGRNSPVAARALVHDIAGRRAGGAPVGAPRKQFPTTLGPSRPDC